jgi:hypothetical protein
MSLQESRSHHILARYSFQPLDRDGHHAPAAFGIDVQVDDLPGVVLEGNRSGCDGD